MIKRVLKKAYHVIAGAPVGEKDTTWTEINKLSKMRAPGAQLEGKVDETLFYLNMVKNAATVKTGEYEALTRLFTGQKMYVDTRDISVAPALMLDGYWEQEITHVYRKVISEDDILFDIGANFGYFGIVGATQLGEGKGSIHFFEANPHLTPFIFKSAAVNGFVRRSHIVNKAITDKPGKLKLGILKDFWGSSSVGFSEKHIRALAGNFEVAVEETVEVEAITIDDYCRQNNIAHVDVIKMDIEGSEEAAYRGMQQTIKNSPRLKMLIEFSPLAYKDPKKLFENIQKDFAFTYAITNDNGGSLVRLTDYAHLKQHCQNGWAMLLAAKQEVIL